MRWSHGILVLIFVCAVFIIAAVTAYEPSEPPAPVGDSLSIDEHTIKEIETERLVCAVAWSTLGHNVAISCVPNIPGMFEEPGR